MKVFYLYNGPEIVFPDLLHLIVQDHQADLHYQRVSVFTRQLEEINGRVHKAGIVNVFVSRDVVTSRIIHPTFGSPNDFLAGWTVCKKNYFKRLEIEERITDSAEAQICLGTRLINPNDPFYHRTLAHEIGHLLIQSQDEHVDFGVGSDTYNIMNQFHKGNQLNPQQLIEALGYHKDPKTLLILEKQIEENMYNPD